MQRGLFAGSPPFTMLIMLAFTMVACYSFIMLVGMLLVPPVFGLSIDELMNIFNGANAAQRLNVMRFLQIFDSIGRFVLPSFLAAYLFSSNTINYLRLRQGASVKWFAAALLLMFVAIPLINMLVALNEMIVFPESLAWLEQRLKNSEDNARQMTHLFLNVDNAGGLIFNIFMMAMLPAIGEELIFRGLLHKIFVKWSGSIHITVIVIGFLFSLMHLQFYGFFPRWALGVMFGYLMVWSGTIWLPIFAHFVNNAAVICFSYFIHKGTISEKIETFGANPADIFAIIATTAVCAALLWIMSQKWAKYKEKFC